jgi:hypothetical protein
VDKNEAMKESARKPQFFHQNHGFLVLIYNHHSPAGKKKSDERISQKTAVFSSKPRFLVLEITRNSGSLILKFQKPGTKGYYRKQIPTQHWVEPENLPLLPVLHPGCCIGSLFSQCVRFSGSNLTCPISRF